MPILDRFLAYAQDFEKTYVDDDWSRLERYFAPDATYEVTGATPALLKGRDAIFRGIKKSLDGFDRKFAGRDIAVTSGPDVAGDELRAGWQVTYKIDGKPPFVLRGRSEAHFRDGKISYLADSYAPSVADELAAWQKKTGVALDPSYT